MGTKFHTRPLLLVGVVFVLLGYVNCRRPRSPFRQQFPNKYPEMIENGVDPGKPLFLTPYIKKGDIDTGRKLSVVGPLEGTSQTSYSGFLTVNETYNSNLFFWFFPAQKNPEEAPILLWLQGGPGGSSLFGLFVENGPISVDKNIKLIPKDVTWNSKYSMIYIDNPVGTGFSFTDKDEGYATNEVDVGENLYSALAQFFQLFPEYKHNDFYLTGESYAGKYIPAVAHRIHIEEHPKKVLLRGVAIGDGFSDPITMIPQYPDLLYQVGMLDENQRDFFQKQCNNIASLIDSKKYLDAFKALGPLMNDKDSLLQNVTGWSFYYNYLIDQLWDALLNGDQTEEKSYFTNVTGSSDYYNFMRCKPPAAFGYYPQYLAKPEVRKAIHVGNLPYNSGDKVEKFLENDITQSVKPWLAEVMNYYKVLIYSGQLDVIVGLPLTQAMLQTVPWQYLDEYKSASRSIWKVNPSDTEVAGYVRRVHDFYQVVVRGGGHILPYDQPERSFDLIDRFISGRPFA